MEIMEIIKDSLTFPVNNLKSLAIYIIITFALGILIAGGLVSSISSFNDGMFAVLAFIFFVLVVLVGFILAGYEIDIIKTGIIQADEAPNFSWKNDLVRGIKAIIVAIIYFIVPAIITIFTAMITNVPGQIVDITKYVTDTAVNTNATVVASSALDMVPPEVMAGLAGSVSLTVLVAVVLFVIFSFFQYMANARLANTDSLAEALNIPEAFRDIRRIGIAKVVAVVVLLFIVSMVVNGIITVAGQYVPYISILSIIATPFLMFAMNRANGLLYSDIT
jgi:hypothetical protein